MKTNWGEVQRNESARAHAEAIRAKDALIKQYSKELQERLGQLDLLLALKKQRANPPVLVSTVPGRSEAVAFAVASDWHCEETVRADSVNGLNEFDLAIAEVRIQKFFNSIVRLTEIERAGTQIDTLVLALLGDLITGYIHEELQETNGLSPVEAILWVMERVISGIRYLQAAGEFKRIIVPCCYGNHGRTTKKPRHATGAANSFEWLLYHMLAKALPELEWHIATGYHVYIEVFGKKIRLHHGDAIRYEGGIGGLTIPLEKAIAAWNKAMVADLDIHGHWHTQMQTPKVVSNGSLIGYNAFSLQIKAPFEPPQQTYFLLDSKRGRTVTAPITLT